MSEMVDVSQLVQPKDAKPEDVRDIYDRYANYYDEDIDPSSSYPVLSCVTKTFVETLGKADKNIHIMDLGAGTGHAAIELRKYGFTNIDGLDVSPEMLKKAKEKEAYKRYICEAVTEKRLDIPTGTYDAIISVGAVTSGYIKASAFDEILRLAKPGGHIVFTVRKGAFDQDEYGYSEKFQRFVNDGKWNEVKKYSTDYVVGHMDDIKKCYVLCYKVLKNE